MREQNVLGGQEEGKQGLRREDNGGVQGPVSSPVWLEWTEPGRAVGVEIPKTVGTQMVESLVGWSKEFSFPLSVRGKPSEE